VSTHGALEGKIQSRPETEQCRGKKRPDQKCTRSRMGTKSSSQK